MAKLKTLKFVKKQFFLHQTSFFMYVFNMSATYLQSVEKIQWKP